MEKKWICDSSKACKSPCCLEYKVEEENTIPPLFCPFDGQKIEWKQVLSDFKMLIGIPGSGKSTWLKNNSNDSIIVCPDQIRKELTKNISDQSKNNEVWKIAKERIIEEIKDSQNVILDATNVNTQLRRKFMEDITDCNKIAVLFRVTPEVAAERIQKDIENSVDRSKVPEDVVYRMYGEYLYTEKVIKEENFDKIIYV